MSEGITLVHIGERTNAREVEKLTEDDQRGKKDASSSMLGRRQLEEGGIQGQPDLGGKTPPADTTTETTKRKSGVEGEGCAGTGNLRRREWAHHVPGGTGLFQFVKPVHKAQQLAISKQIYEEEKGSPPMGITALERGSDTLGKRAPFSGSHNYDPALCGQAEGNGQRAPPLGFSALDHGCEAQVSGGFSTGLHSAKQWHNVLPPGPDRAALQ
ncbi:hypothetical protein NDU88_002885 [Pleurodeles waltl]|uniref:Uncharacterized protein n=1 Tax=Pleurodeles waltl TaxID=8319 RepID=A0AAV7TPJ8_PLEWA|nr:hypothetical protein NDU88_002885 [Pleurodeles waltl]